MAHESDYYYQIFRIYKGNTFSNIIRISIDKTCLFPSFMLNILQNPSAKFFFLLNIRKKYSSLVFSNLRMLYFDINDSTEKKNEPIAIFFS